MSPRSCAIVRGIVASAPKITAASRARSSLPCITLNLRNTQESVLPLARSSLRLLVSGLTYHTSLPPRRERKKALPDAAVCPRGVFSKLRGCDYLRTSRAGGHMVSIWCPEEAEMRTKGRLVRRTLCSQQKRGLQIWRGLPCNPLGRVRKPLLCPSELQAHRGK